MSHISDLQEDLLLDAAKTYMEVAAMLVKMVRHRNTESRMFTDGEAYGYHRFVQVKIADIRNRVRHADEELETVNSELSE